MTIFAMFDIDGWASRLLDRLLDETGEADGDAMQG